MRNRIPVIAVSLFLIAALLGAGCAAGARSYGSLTLEEAKGVFDAAKFTGAAIKSPYEFYSAEIYLKKAADEMDLGNNKLAGIYLKKAYDQAQIAYENAKRYQRSK